MGDNIDDETFSWVKEALEKADTTPRSMTDVKLPEGKSDTEAQVVDCKATMTMEDFKKCTIVMDLLKNMIQCELTDAAKEHGIDPVVALTNMAAWVRAYVDFPLPYINFEEMVEDEYTKEDFSLDVDPDIVDKICSIEGVPDLKNAIQKVLQGTKGKLLQYEGSEKHFNYFGIVTAYMETHIFVRLIKFSMFMKDTKVEALCSKVTKTSIKTSYMTYKFAANKEFLTKTWEKIGDETIDMYAKQLLKYLKRAQADRMRKYKEGLGDIFKS